MKMKQVTLEKIADVTCGEYRGSKQRRSDRIESVVTDSRAAEKGSLFVCIKGARADGHDFAAEAAEKGAVCRISEKKLDDGYPYILVRSSVRALRDLAAWYRGLFKIPVIGIVGSVGKTTAKELAADVLSVKYKTLRTSGNFNNAIGVPLTLLSLRDGHEAAVVEMGISDFGEMSVLADMVRPDICVVTNIGYCHLENLIDLTGVLKAKSEVFSFMRPNAVAVINGDDESLRDFDPGIEKVTYGIGADNDIHAENIKNLGFDGLLFDISADGTNTPAAVPAFGTHIVYGALAAAAVGRILNVPAEDISLGLENYKPVGGRANVIDTGYITIIDDCYNANPNSMEASLRSLASAGQNRRRVAILGDMRELGRDSKDLHRRIGELTAEIGIDLVISCGEDGRNIYEGVKSAGGQGAYYSDKKELIRELGDLVEPGDIVLAKASHGMGFDEIVSALKELSDI